MIAKALLQEKSTCFEDILSFYIGKNCFEEAAMNDETI